MTTNQSNADLDRERELPRLADAFVQDEIGFHPFFARFDELYFRPQSDESLTASAEEFWDEVAELLNWTGDDFDIPVNEFKLWLTRQRQHYPVLDESDLPKYFPPSSPQHEPPLADPADGSGQRPTIDPRQLPLTTDD